MSNLIAKIGSDHFLLCKIFPEIIQLFDFFKTFTNKTIQNLADIINKRISTADEYYQAAAAYFLTTDGHKFY